MGTFSEDDFGNFANDGARETLALWTAKLVATITEVMADDGRLAPDEDGESLLMPSVDILALLCERCGAVPPRPATVRQWADKYLATYDRRIDRRKPKPRPEFKAARRKVVGQTFRWLESVAEAHWGSEEGPPSKDGV
jgi:hypothetical protein